MKGLILPCVYALRAVIAEETRHAKALQLKKVRFATFTFLGTLLRWGAFFLLLLIICICPHT